MPRGPTTAWVDITGLISEWFQTTSLKKKSQKEVLNIVLHSRREANIPSNRLLLPRWWRSKGGTRYISDSHHHHLNDDHLHYHNIMKIRNFSLRQGLTNSLVALGLEGTAIDQKYFHSIDWWASNKTMMTITISLIFIRGLQTALQSFHALRRLGAEEQHWQVAVIIFITNAPSLSSRTPSLLVSYPTRWSLLFIFGILHGSFEVGLQSLFM